MCFVAPAVWSSSHALMATRNWFLFRVLRKAREGTVANWLNYPKTTLIKKFGSRERKQIISSQENSDCVLDKPSRTIGTFLIKKINSLPVIFWLKCDLFNLSNIIKRYMNRIYSKTCATVVDTAAFNILPQKQSRGRRTFLLSSRTHRCSILVGFEVFIRSLFLLEGPTTEFESMVLIIFVQRRVLFRPDFWSDLQSL